MKSSNLSGKDFLRICIQYGYCPQIILNGVGRAYLSARCGVFRSPYSYCISSREFTYDFCKRILQKFDELKNG